MIPSHYSKVQTGEVLLAIARFRAAAAEVTAVSSSTKTHFGFRTKQEYLLIKLNERRRALRLLKKHIRRLERLLYGEVRLKM